MGLGGKMGEERVEGEVKWRRRKKKKERNGKKKRKKKTK